jgi:uncharacterized membrane protein
MDLVLAAIFAMGGVICHQRPDRSFFVEGHQLPVCARCTGLYVSAAIGLLGWWAMKIARRWQTWTIDPRLAVRLLLIAAVPTGVSLASAAIGWWEGSNLSRALLAIPLGVSGGAIVAAVSTKDLR